MAAVEEAEEIGVEVVADQLLQPVGQLAPDSGVDRRLDVLVASEPTGHVRHDEPEPGRPAAVRPAAVERPPRSDEHGAGGHGGLHRGNVGGGVVPGQWFDPG